MKHFLFVIALLFSFFLNLNAQPVPGLDENIPYLMTFGAKAEKSWGDDDFSQTFFFLIPENYKSPIYIRVYDPDTGGDLDELKGVFDTKMLYSVYGGKGAHSDPDAMGVDPKGNYKSGNLLASKAFGADPRYDKNWYTFGPFNPTEGEFTKEFGGYVFKVICDGTAGDDGNMYRYFLSTSGTENKAIEGGFAFSYEYSFRMWDNPNQISHIYPYVIEQTEAVKMMNFDWDSDGIIRVVSVARKGQDFEVSGDNEWKEVTFAIKPEEKKTSLDFQFIKKQGATVKNNNVVINVRNQYNEVLRFYTVPIGGVPKYKYKLTAKPIKK
jgi:hypothetical protein